MGLELEQKSGDKATVAYKVVELESVTDKEIERVLNEWSALGWSFEGIQFAMSASKRPAMAFVLFIRAS